MTDSGASGMTQAKVAAFMTAPRYEAVWARNVIELALRKAGIPLVVSGGVFYGQCMQNMLEDAIENGIEIALTVDFDSVFTVEHIHRLLGVLAGQDYIDALAAMQCRRGSLFPLFTQGGNTLIEFDGHPIEVTTAHFGLTAIKLNRLVDVPKPWFHSQPRADGRWIDNKIDDDIWFWRQWREAGRTVYVDADCRIGHLEEMIACFDDDMQPQHIHPEQWRRQWLPKPGEQNDSQTIETVAGIPGGACVPADGSRCCGHACDAVEVGGVCQ